MRRIAVLSALPLLAVGVLAGCGGSSSNSSAAPAVTVSGTFGKTPAVTIPAQKAGSKLAVKTLVHGSGQALAKTDAFVGNYAIYLWSGTSHKLLQSTFKTGGKPTLFSGTLLPGLETALIGQKMGSRVLAVIPPKEGFGTSGDAQAGIKGTDTLVFVVDMIKDFSGTAAATGPAGVQRRRLAAHGDRGGAAGTAPTITMPKGNPPANLTTKVLIKGTGPTVAAGRHGRGPVRRRDLAQRLPVRLVLEAEPAVRLHHRRQPQPGDPGLGQGPGRARPWAAG